MLWVSFVSVLCSAETCSASEGAQPQGPQFVIWLQEFPFSSSLQNPLGSDSILGIPVRLFAQSF